MIPQIQQVVVKDKGWLSEEEMVDCIAVSQSMPGAHCHQQRNLYWQEDEWIFWRGSCDDRSDRTIVSHHYSHCFIPGDGGRKSLYPGCVCWDKSSGLRIRLRISAVKLGKQIVKGPLQWILAVAAFLAIGVFGITAVWAVLAGAVVGILYNTLWLERKNRKKEEEK